ncbi:Hpt domain-containing protein [Ramlibacter tataouinensis]|uniref:Hpt domain-containing protein n=1 Tax=Ramlibacter tataouinensis TaxID=94132 RepID=UPI0022F4024A|nr:Hpt domain-containing protein [Ramlibacter tataouinensis]WBY00391.1 Hpt domain-containing protein [Ramlibacter tataouinensis]
MTQLPPVVPGLDIERGLRQCGGRTPLYQALLRLYLQHSGGFGAELRGALARGDRAAAARMAHTLKGSSAQVGATRIEQLAAELESALRGQARVDDTLAQLAQLEPALSALLAALAPHLAPD